MPVHASPHDDVALLAQWRAGDRAAGNTFVDRHFAAVYGFVRRRLADVTAAKDLAQQTFLACLEAGDRFAPTHGVRLYVLGIARNLLFRHFRDAHGPDEATVVTRSTPTPSRILAEARERSWIREQLAELPAPLRTTLELHYWDELSIAEIAALLEIAAGTVKWRLHRGRALLRERLEIADVPPELRASTLQTLDRLDAHP
jgi:RNA polymerase sigma factor (sigma-70 family)